MKTIYKALLFAGITSTALTGCIEETIPTNIVTQKQVMSSPSAASSFAMAMPSNLNSVFVLGRDDLHFDWGYGSIMHIRDVMTADMPVKYSPSGYDWYLRWENNSYQGDGYVYCQFIWNFLYGQVLTANNTIGSVDPNTERADLKYFLGAGYAMRAFAYLDLARMYEYLPNDGTSASAGGNDVTGLTVPIITEAMTEAEARVNPRRPHAEMSEFILGDLDKAEELIVAQARTSKTMPDLAVVYGLKARLYMWDENYPKAAEYARKAINESGATPTTKDQWLDRATGFNTLSTPSWMMGMQIVKEDDQVQTGIINWTSWMSNETSFGYSSPEPLLMIDPRLYDKMNDTDFRKLSYVAPVGSPLESQVPFINREQLAASDIELCPYASLKFRPGQGNMDDYNISCAVAVPLMRVEEMYLIEAEATAHTNAAQGKSLLESFMKYRDTNYTCTNPDIVDEVFQQKRAEFWGEGLIYFDYKRLNKPVVRGYDGTKFREGTQFNTTTRPAWMNIVIIRSEQNNNRALVGFNNPDPSGVYASEKYSVTY